MSEVQISYFEERMQLLGVTKELNIVQLRGFDIDKKENSLIEYDVFSEVKEGIFIRCYTIDRYPIHFKKEGSRWNNNDYGIIRLTEPLLKKDGSVMKYRMPKGMPTVPFFPPALLDKYENKEPIKTLYITEGYFKAFKAQMHGIDCVGLPSITCMRDKETGKLHGDIHKLIATCSVERIVWLTDGDCRDITSKEITDGADLYRRPAQFFNTVKTFYDLLSGYDSINKYFAHINTDNFDSKPKGLDDLLCALPNETEEIAKEFASFEKESGQYRIVFNITFGIGKINRYFMLHDVDIFYLHHVEKRPELKNKNFKFNGTLYNYNEDQGKCEIKIPGEASQYFRVGDAYYQYVKIPNRYNELEQQYHKRQKETIREDHGKGIFAHIPKYQAFCTVPDHLNYQRVIHNCFNAYFPFEHEPEEGECATTLEFIKHIFGDDLVFDEKGNKIPRWQLGLDYLTLLYKKPQQVLPILSLVSNERQTGKTTFIKWLNMIFTENVAIVGNDDLGAQFNAHWSSKLIIACDETKIDKVVVMEKIKSLSTASKIMMNSKGIDQRSTEFFGKFILCSNNEDNFANIDKDEIRFWVIKVPAIKGRNVDLLDDLLIEIPAFLHYLNGRSMVTQHRERHWFDTRLLRTDALDRVVQNSRPNVEKLIVHAITELFEATELNTICMPLAAIASEILKKPHDKDYVRRIMTGMGYELQPPQRREYPRIVEEKAVAAMGSTETSIKLTAIAIKFHGRYYEFKREDFIEPTETELPF
jgi:hypothetical protein